MALFTRQFQVT